MKISYNNYPILKKLREGSLGVMPIFETDKLYFDRACDQFVKYWKHNNKQFQHEINVISRPFYEASIKAQPKLLDLWSDIMNNDTSDFDTKGCYLWGEYVFMINYESKKGIDAQEMYLYIFDKKGTPLAMYMDSGKLNYRHIWISSIFSVENNEASIEKWIYTKFVSTVTFRMFKTYAEVETKIIPPNSKIVDIKCKYVNDTRLPIAFLDSKWFTTLVKSDAFTVSGHFRLQPYGEGMKQRKLIWINQFEKLGYTAPAIKLLSDNTA